MKSLKLGIITSALLCGSLVLIGAEFSAKGKSTEKIRLNGRIQAQFENLKTEDSAAADPATVNHFMMRRIYLGAKGTLMSGVTGEINTQFSGSKGEASLNKAFITVKPHEGGKLSFGYTKLPVGYEETTSSSKIHTVERSIVTRYFHEQLDLGGRYLGIHYSTGAGPLYLKGSITNDTQKSVSGNTGAEDNVFAVSGRAGIKGSTESFKYDAGVYGARFGDETKASEDETITFGAYADLSFGVFGLEAEVMSGNFDNGSTDSSPIGYHIMPSLKINDHFDIVARYAYLDGDSAKDIDISDTSRKAPDGSAGDYVEANSYYFGGNWYIDGHNLKVTAGYEMAEYQADAGDADVSGFRARLQLLF